MRVGFLNNQIDNRGTGNAVFDYAHYNEEILGNESYIYTLDHSPQDIQMYLKVVRRFGPPNDFPISKLDVLYHIKSGAIEGTTQWAAKRYVVHAVFDYQPHGDRYAVISPWMGRIHNSPYVPHIVSLPETTVDLRGTLGIPKDAIVFGRYGGADSFDIPFVWSAINRALKTNKNIWFLFMNTNQPDDRLIDRSRMIFLIPTADSTIKREFINTCDAMLHARQRGETFGISVGEFALAKKQIVTYGLSGERSHLEDFSCFTYNDEEQLYEMLSEPEWVHEPISYNYYTEYTPEKVMKKFKEVFLD